MEAMRDNEVYQIDGVESTGLEINFMDLVSLLWGNIVGIILCACCLGLAAYLYVSVAISPTYQASSTMYVINSQNADAALTYSDIQSSTYLVNDSKKLITSKNVIKQAIANLELEDVTASQILSNLSVTIEDETRFLRVTVTNTDPYLAADLANMICEVARAEIQDKMNVDKVSIVDVAEVPSAPAGPNVKKYVATAGILGALLMIIIVLVRYLLDDTLKSSDDVEKYLHLSVLGTIPEIEVLANNQKKKKKKH